MTAVRHREQKPQPVSPARKTAVRVLSGFCQSRKPLNLLVNDAMGGLAPREQSLMAELSYGSVRWQIQSDWLLSHFIHGSFGDYPPVVQSVLRTGIYQLRHLSQVPARAAIHQAVAISRALRHGKYARLVNAVLRGYQRGQESLPWPRRDTDPDQWLSVTFSFPHWLAVLIREQYGMDRAAEILDLLNQRPWLTLRVNTLKTSVPAYRALLQAGNILFEPGGYLPEYLHLRDYRGRVQALPGYQDGLFSIQDESAGVPACAVREAGAGQVTDICAAPGGKASHLAELGGDRWTILALDLSRDRLRLVKENLSRLGIAGVRLLQADGTHLPLRQSPVILLDAPCSGLGVIRKNPDIKIRRQPADLISASRLQERLLEAAAAALPADGTLVYSTCTLNRRENEDMVRQFLRNHPELCVVPIQEKALLPLRSDPGWINTVAALAHLDGGFCARLHRGKTP